MGIQITYDGLALHDMGQVFVTRQRDSYGAAPLALVRRVELTVRLVVTQPQWADNQQMVEDLRAALKKQQGVLVWANELGQELLNQTVSVSDVDWPEEANTPGVRLQQVEFTCAYEDHNLTTQAVELVVTAGETSLTLGRVDNWEEGMAVARFDEHRSERKRTAYQVSASGFLPSDTTQPLATRRAALLAARSDLIAKLDQKEVRLAYGDFDRVVRVSRVVASVQQAVNGIQWSLTADYTRFPDEAAYATAEYRVAHRDEGADQMLALTGKVDATTLTAARAKVASLCATARSAHGFSGALVSKEEDDEGRAEGNADGGAFISLTFTREYRKPLVNTLTVQRSGGPVTALGNVTGWSEQVQTQRFNEFRDERRRVTKQVKVAGQSFANATVSTTARRAELLQLKAAWEAELNSKAVTLIYGDFNQIVRVTDFSIAVDHAVRVLEWSITVEYNVLPNEVNYSLLDYTITERRDGGDSYLSLAGRIQADTESRARAKLTVLRAAILSARGYTAGLVIREEDTVSRAESADGTAFQELGFTEEYRKQLPNTIRYQRSGGEAVNLGQVTGWRQGFEAARFAAMRDQRNQVLETVNVEGRSFANATADLATRRTQLAALADQWKAELNSKSGTLTYGDFNRTVRVSSFAVEMDEAVRTLQWRLVSEYSLFPNEADYATADYTIGEADEGADQKLTVSGRIQANSLTKARAKREAIILAALNGRGYEAGLESRREEGAVQVEANADGTAFIELTFTREYRKLLANAASFQGAGGTVRTLGQITGWAESYRATRYNPLRSQRNHAGGAVAAKGQFYADATLPLEARRADLQATIALWEAEFNRKEGTLIHGDFNKTVRVVDFQAGIDEAVRRVEWSLSAEYSRFPNEDGYALVEYSVRSREDTDSGQVVMSFGGRIGAQSASAARARLNDLRTAVLAQNTGYAKLKGETAESTVEGDTDGVAFIELTFEEEYQKAVSSIVRSEFTVSSADDAVSGLVRKTYSGQVTARGNDFAAAEAAARAEAARLGDNRSQFRLSANVTVQDRQTLTTGERFVQVQFSYEYQERGAREYWQVQSEVNRSYFGEDSESVSGYVVAPTAAAALAIYTGKVKALYGTRLIREERTSQEQVYLSKMNLTSGAVVSGQYETQWLRLSFSLAVHREKELDETAMRYDTAVAIDDRTNTKTVTLSGTVWAKDVQLNESGGLVRASGKKTKAEKVLETFLAGFNGWTGTLERREYRERTDYFLGSTTTTADDRKKCTALDFTLTFNSKLTAADKILLTELSEVVEHSGVRWVTQNIPSGRAVIQNCGYNAGSRTVSGKVASTSEAVADAWIAAQQALLAGTYVHPAMVTTEFKFLPLTTGVARGGGANVTVFEKSFRFSEILVDLDYDAPV